MACKNGIDISGHQKGIDIAGVPCDFVIVKATEGRTYVNPEYKKQIAQAEALGKYLGVYHYATGADIQAQADHFYNTVKPYIGKAILALDWEEEDNPRFTANDYKFCERLLEAIKEKTGIAPFLYMSKSVARQFKWEVGRQFPFWCAQYPDTTTKIYEYKTNPWTDSKGWGAWEGKGCKIHQYCSRGRLGNYPNNLDVNISYMDGDEWLAWAKGEVKPEPLDLDTIAAKPILRRGDRNKYVELWQMYLKENCFYDGKVDGIFGPKTETAVMNYQQKHGIEAGYIGALTWGSLPMMQ